jgi:hypothetical protein
MDIYKGKRGKKNRKGDIFSGKGLKYKKHAETKNEEK